MQHKGTEHGEGSARRAVQYLLQEMDSHGELRAGVDVLRGDPWAVADVADSLPFKWKYSSSIVGWALEEDPQPHEIEAVLNDIEAAYFAGMEPGRVQWCAVLHTGQDGRKDLHILTADVDLESGLHFNPLPPGHMYYMDAMRDYHNWANGWARPDDPARAVLSQVGRAEAAGELPAMPTKKADMHAVLDKMIDDGLLATSADVRAQVRQWGDVTREGADYISIKPPGAGRAVRLKGEKFKRGWTAAAEPDRQARKQLLRSTGRGGVVDLDVAAAARVLFNDAVAGRAKYNEKRYPASPAIDPHEIMAQFRAEQQVQNERDRAATTAAIERVAAAETERNQRFRATVEGAVTAARAATADFRQLEHNSHRADTAVRRVAFRSQRAGAMLAELGNRVDGGVGQLGVIGRRAALHRGQKRSDAGDGNTPVAGRGGVAAAGEWLDRIAELGRRIARAAEALSVVRLLLPEPVQPVAETAAVTDDALDAALAAAVSKAQQHQVEQDIPQPQRPVIESTEIDLESDPLAQPASPQPVQRGSVLMSAAVIEPYRAPSADGLTELQRELDSRPEPTDDELVDLVPEGLAEALELLDEQQDQDGIDLDELDDGPSGPSFG